MKIRRAQRRDIEAIAKLWEDLFDYETELIVAIDPSFIALRKKDKSFKRRVRSELMKQLKNRNAALFVAEEQEESVGFAEAIIKDNKWIVKFPTRGSLNWLMVKKTMRGKGIATLIYAAVKNWYKQKGVKFETLGIVPNNPVKDIYHAWGFKDSALFMWKKM
jgi:GNAT superfamily N-acetyltransferase